MHYEGVPVSSYYVIAEFASVQIIFGATVWSIVHGVLHSITNPEYTRMVKIFQINQNELD